VFVSSMSCEFGSEWIHFHDFMFMVPKSVAAHSQHKLNPSSYIVPFVDFIFLCLIGCQDGLFDDFILSSCVLSLALFAHLECWIACNFSQISQKPWCLLCSCCSFISQPELSWTTLMENIRLAALHDFGSKVETFLQLWQKKLCILFKESHCTL
jgi:hypothetical protein